VVRRRLVIVQQSLEIAAPMMIVNLAHVKCHYLLQPLLYAFLKPIPIIIWKLRLMRSIQTSCYYSLKRHNGTVPVEIMIHPIQTLFDCIVGTPPWSKSRLKEAKIVRGETYPCQCLVDWDMKFLLHIHCFIWECNPIPLEGHPDPMRARA